MRGGNFSITFKNLLTNTMFVLIMAALIKTSLRFLFDI